MLIDALLDVESAPGVSTITTDTSRNDFDIGVHYRPHVASIVGTHDTDTPCLTVVSSYEDHSLENRPGLVGELGVNGSAHPIDLSGGVDLC